LLPWIVLGVIVIALFLQRRRLAIVSEFWRYPWACKNWWLLPIILALILIIGFIIVVEVLGPSMYAIF
jgi:hypothetical protein